MKERWYLILILLIVFVSDDTLLFGTNANPVFEYVKYACYLISTIGLLVNVSITKSSTKSTRIAISMCLLILFSSFINNDVRMGLLYKMVIILFAAMFSKHISLKLFAYKYCKVISFLAFVSIIGTVLAMIVPSFYSFAPKITNTAGNVFNNLYVYVVSLDFGSIRNYGIYREPGVYQMYLVLALFFELFIVESYSIKRIACYIVALLLTFSTTGFISLFLILILFQISGEKNRISVKQKRIFGCFVFVVSLYLVFYTDMLSSEGVVFGKLSNEDDHSSIARMSSITSNIEIWLNNPLFGAGLQSVADQFPLLTLQRYGFPSTHNTNTFLCELATFGIFYFILFVMGIYKFCKNVTHTSVEKILLILIMCVLSVGEKLTFSPFFYIIIFYGYHYIPHILPNVEVQNKKI